MSRNHGTLRCPSCGETFTVDNLTFTPVCPNCGYVRSHDSQPKFTLIAEKEETHATGALLVHEVSPGGEAPLR